MSIAVCFKCGMTKLEPARPCTKCHVTPASEDDLAVSMALTDTILSTDELTDIASNIQKGRPYRLDPSMRTRLIVALRKSGRYPRAKRATDVTGGDAKRRSIWARLFGR